jgi:hypothetical protein
LTEDWKRKHVLQSQYLLQIVKCADTNCCKPVRTNLREFLRDQFLPAPIPVIKSTKGLRLGRVEERDSHFQDLSSRLACGFLLDFPVKCFDTFCPSAQKKIHDPAQSCVECGAYFVTKIALKMHKKVHNSTGRFESVEDLEHGETQEDDAVIVDDGIFFIDDLSEWLSPVFTDEQSEPAP